MITFQSLKTARKLFQIHCQDDVTRTIIVGRSWRENVSDTCILVTDEGHFADLTVARVADLSSGIQTKVKVWTDCQHLEVDYIKRVGFLRLVCK